MLLRQIPESGAREMQRRPRGNLACRRPYKAGAFRIELRIERRVQACSDKMLERRVSGGRTGSDAAGKRVDLAVEIDAWRRRGSPAPFFRRARIHGIAQHQPFERALRSEAARHRPCCPAVGIGPQSGVGGNKRRILGRRRQSRKPAPDRRRRRPPRRALRPPPAALRPSDRANDSVEQTDQLAQ